MLAGSRTRAGKGIPVIAFIASVPLINTQLKTAQASKGATALDSVWFIFWCPVVGFPVEQGGQKAVKPRPEERYTPVPEFFFFVSDDTPYTPRSKTEPT